MTVQNVLSGTCGQETRSGEPCRRPAGPDGPCHIHRAGGSEGRKTRGKQEQKGTTGDMRAGETEDHDENTSLPERKAGLPVPLSVPAAPDLDLDSAIRLQLSRIERVAALEQEAALDPPEGYKPEGLDNVMNRNFRTFLRMLEVRARLARTDSDGLAGETDSHEDFLDDPDRDD